MEDEPAVKALLNLADLPLEGVTEHLDAFLVVENEGLVIAAAGLERYGDSALLRSVVVAIEHRGTGLGARLVRACLDASHLQPARSVYLLTTTAEQFFRRFGFAPIKRSAVPRAVQSSHELTGACPASAIAMGRIGDAETSSCR